MKKHSGSKFLNPLLLVTASFCFGLSASVIAAPGEISNTPLYMGVGVAPNILYVLDDSGSMRFEVLKRRSAESSTTGYPRQILSCSWYSCSYAYDDGSLAREAIDYTPNTKQEALENCAGYNATAYDPSITYVPWVGTDNDGNVFGDASFTNAYRDPYARADGRNLTNHKYMVWTDADGDKEFDRGECGENESDAYNTNYESHSSVFSIPAEQQTNYANWYSYYRSRANVLKGALSSILDISEEYVGLATIQHDSDVRTPVKNLSDINPNGTPNEDADTNRIGLRQRIFQLDPDGGTPLKQATHNAGRYFEKGLDPSNGFLGSAPGDPIVESCQQNYMVLMTDGYYNGDFTVNYGNADNTGGTLNSEYDGGDYADDVSNSLADIAMHYYERDLDTTLANDVQSNNDDDTNPAQHMVMYGVAFGVFGNLTGPPDTWVEGDGNAWPSDIDDDSPETIDDLLHATYNGRGAFFSASNPEELVNDLNHVRLSIVNNAEGTAAAVGFNSTNISADSLLFQGWFNSATWEGELRALSFADGVVGSEKWEASDKLAERDFTAEGMARQVITFNGTKGIPFEAPESYSVLNGDTLAQHQVDDLLTNSPYASGAPENQDFLELMVDFFRADTGDENIIDGTSVMDGENVLYTFRSRADRFLSDIVNSSPQYVAKPSAPYPNFIEGSDDPYQTFATQYADRTPVVYVGANDGMLHAFEATEDGGEEIFAYIPGLLFSNQDEEGLHELAEDVYTHRSYVDGTPTIADVFVDSKWSTYLVGGLGGGGKGIYVLDVTNPATLTEANADKIVKFEFTHENLGYTFSRPQIAKLNNGRWAAIFGNGYNNNGTGEASLFIVYLDGDGSDYKEITTGAGTIVNGSCFDPASDCNGLSAPTVLDITGDAKADRVYAGDVHGNLWAFDLSGDTENSWDVAHKNAGSVPLFIACTDGAATCSKEDRQPITVKPVVVAHATERDFDKEPNLFVMFGTGQYLVKADGTSSTADDEYSSQQSFYGVWDAGDGHDKLRRTDLREQTITPNGVNRQLSSNEVNYSTEAPGHHGWYMDLPATGERSVVTPIVAGDFVFFATTIPDDSSCSGGGSGFLMATEIFTGAQPDITVFHDLEETAGIPLDNIPGGSVIIDNDVVISDSKGNILDYEVKLRKDEPSRRSSWSVLK